MSQADNKNKTTRPAVPRETARDILIEAGHRCSVCGESSSLEKAHIVPWRETKSHEKENLICLCANCHDRADREGWGQKTLKSYKERPWIFRHKELNPNPEKTSQVEIVIDYEFKDFDEAKEAHLLYAIVGFLQVSPGDVKIVKKEEGSVRLVIEMPSNSAEQLVKERAGLVADLPFLVEGLRILEEEKARLTKERANVGERAENEEQKKEYNDKFFDRQNQKAYSIFREFGYRASVANKMALDVIADAQEVLKNEPTTDLLLDDFIFKLISDVCAKYQRQIDLGAYRAAREKEIADSEWIARLKNMYWKELGSSRTEGRALSEPSQKQRKVDNS